MSKVVKILLVVFVILALAVTIFSVNAFFKLRDYNAYIKDLNGQIDSLYDQLGSVAPTIPGSDDLSKRIADLQQENQNLKNSATELQQAVDTKDKEIQQLKDQIKELTAQQPGYIHIPVDPSKPYQSKYPEMYVRQSVEYIDREGKVIYLTFDDGPSERTDEILKILEKEGIKATFFVVPTESDICAERLRKIINAGHAIGIHSRTHAYEKIYSSTEAFLDDFYAAYTIVKKATGYEATVYRYPGGSLNASYDIIDEMQRRGFIYYDWNVSGDDSAGQKTAEGITGRVMETLGSRKKGVVLLHDTDAKKATVEALPGIIAQLKEKGYSFAAIDQTLNPKSFQQRKPK